MSADYGTEHFKGYGHHRDGHDWIHVTYKDEGESTLGSFTLTEICELVQLAGQAWPARVEVRYVIEARRPGQEWRVVWSALADDDFDAGVSQEFAAETFNGMRHASAEWRLARRTVLAADEILNPEEDQADGR